MPEETRPDSPNFNQPGWQADTVNQTVVNNNQTVINNTFSQTATSGQFPESARLQSKSAAARTTYKPFNLLRRIQRIKHP